jgi:prepilin-type N-terminal cleavage/methylation domain-containing protein
MQDLDTRSEQSGFSLTELLIVCGVMLVVAAMAAPTFFTAIDTYKMRSSAMDVAALAQRARMRAIKDNSTYAVRTQVTGGVPAYTQVYEDLNNNGQQDAGERMMQLPLNLSMPNSGNPTLSNATLGFTAQPLGTLVSFNARGLPCVVSNGICSNWLAGQGQVGFVFFLQDTRNNGNGWAAVSISPAGRVKVWTWSSDSSSWNY